MGFFKNLFGNKSEDDASATSKPDPEKSGDATAQSVETKPEPRTERDRNNADSTSRSSPTPLTEQEESEKTTEKNQTSTKTERKEVNQPPPFNNVVQLKSVSVSAAPARAKNEKRTSVEPAKVRSRDELKASEGPVADRSVRESAPKIPQSDDPTKYANKRSNSLGRLAEEKPDGFQQSQVRTISKSPRESLPVSQSKTKVVGSGLSAPNNSKAAPRSLKEKLIASTDAAKSSRDRPKSRNEARVFRTAMMQAKEKSIPPEEPVVDPKSAVEWAFEPASRDNDAKSKAVEAVLQDDSKSDDIQVIFSESVRKRAKGIRDFALELSLGLTPKQWTTYCRDAVGSIARAANALKRTELADALMQFERQLEQANQQLGPSINLSLIAEMNKSYAKLAEQMPECFGITEIAVARERLLVESLLSQVPGIGRNELRRITPEKIGKYRDLCVAEANEMAQKLGVDETVANAIKDNFSAFQKEREAIEPASRIERAHQRLVELAEKLESLHRDFCRADAEDNRENKRKARREQTLTVVQIEVLLADLAETELFGKLRPLPIQKKIEMIKRFLDETASQISAARGSSPASKEVSG